MIYTWYRIFNLTEFNALELTSREYILELENLGQKTIMATKGEMVSILYEGIFLSINLNDENPFAFDGHAVYVDELNDVYLGIEVDED